MTGIHLLKQAAFAAMLGVAGVVACSTEKSTSGVQAGPPTDIEAVSATNSTGLVSQAVTSKPLVRVTDANGIGVPGVQVNFAVTAGGGSVTGANKTTDNSGQAQVGSWTLGPSPGANSLDATATGLNGSPVVFTVAASTVVSNFNIDLVFLNAPTAAQQAAFDQAASRWSVIVTGDLSNTQVTAAANACFTGQPAINQTVDDLLIFVSLVPIDGAGGILGQAGPCYIRNSNHLTIVGVMKFDTADLAQLQTNGTLDDVILHEMGHVLGFGSLWDDNTKNLLVGPASQCAPPPPSASCDPHFIGAAAIAAFNGANGGNTFVTRAKVPVEDQFGAGTADSHWDENEFGNELMTGFIGGVSNPLSLTTIMSLQDLGYTVSGITADPFDWSTSLRAAPPQPSVHMVDDILRIPARVVDDRAH